MAVAQTWCTTMVLDQALLVLPGGMVTISICCCNFTPVTLQEKEEARLREEFAKQGIKIPVKDKSDVFDSNTITPGTPFMHRLSVALQYYIHCRLNSDPGWKKITVSTQFWT